MSNGNSRMSGEDGLIRKFVVERADGDPTGKHADCEYFVLDPLHDPIARKVLSEYASTAQEVGEVALARDLFQWLSDLAANELAEQYRKENGLS